MSAGFTVLQTQKKTPALSATLGIGGFTYGISTKEVLPPETSYQMQMPSAMSTGRIGQRKSPLSQALV